MLSHLCRFFVGVCCSGIAVQCNVDAQDDMNLMANHSKTIKGGGNGKVLPTLSFHWHSGANEREGETLRMRKGRSWQF